MALSIVNNSTAIGAQGNVTTANNNLTKTIEALSTGLRINSASDDPSGLAVSEKLRAQISGLEQAATNAQDAISLLQTAESAMGSMTDLLQRVRELAVQAGDAAYTANDRAMLQLEVDQLLEEIDRISTTTEFNTKKLLNGDAAAIWSASTDSIEAIITGTVAEGNYQISYTVDPGKNAVYKSNIMTIAEGEMSYDIDTNGTSITKFDTIQSMLADTGLTVTVQGSGATTATAYYTGGTGGMSSSSVSLSAFYTASVAVTGNNSYSIEIQAVGNRTASGTGQIQFRVMNTATGELSEWVTATVNSDGTIQNASAISTNLAGISGAVLTSAVATFSSNATWSDGDTMLINVAGARNGATGAASIQIGSSGSTLHILSDATNDNSATTHTIYTAQIDEAGNVYYGSMEVTLAAGNVSTGTATIDILGEGDVASSYTKLSQIAEFTNSDGVMILDNTRELTIYGGNGETAVITLEGSDTIADLLSKLNSAIYDQLGMGASGSDVSTVNNNLAQFVEEGEETSTGANAVAGTFILQGAVLGSDSTMTFVGDESLLNALGLTQIQAATDSELNVWVQDAHTGAWIGEDTITDGRLRNVIQGVDVDINPESAANITYDETTGYFSFTPSGETSVAYLHVQDNSTVAAIGANEGQTIDLSIAQLDTTSLEISGITVATIDDAQSALTKIDIALETLSAARATVGAQINRLEYTITNLDTTRENLTASESRIRDLDIATASTDLASQQVILQSATAMLAQANTIPSYALMLLS